MGNSLSDTANGDKRTVGFLLRCMHCHDGVASHCETLIRGLVAGGWKVVMITGKVHYDATSEYRFNSIRSMVDDWVILEEFKLRGLNRKPMNIAIAAIRRHQIDLLHVHGFSMLPFACQLKLVSRVPCVATYHPSVAILKANDQQTAEEPFKDVKYILLLHLFTPRAFIAYSKEIESWLRKCMKIPASRICKISHGVDVEYFRPPTDSERAKTRNEYGLKEKDLVCVLVGRLSWDKGHDLLINAVKRIMKSYPSVSVKCLFSGSGDVAQMKAYAYADEPDESKFIFAGNVADVREVYWAGDIFVLPSRVEGFALVVAEAMCCGLPPIRTPSGGAFDQIKEGETGFIVPFNDEEALAAAILKLADDDLRSRIKLRCREYAVEAFDSRNMARKTAKLYGEIVGLGV